MNKLRIIRFIEDIVLVINLYEFIEELEFFWVKFIEGINYFDNMVIFVILLFIVLLLKGIFMNLMKKVKSSNIRRGNNIVFFVLCG